MKRRAIIANNNLFMFFVFSSLAFKSFNFYPELQEFHFCISVIARERRAVARCVAVCLHKNLIFFSLNFDCRIKTTVTHTFTFNFI